MKNLLNQTPYMKLSGRTLFTVNKFVEKKDIKNKKVLNVGCGFGWFELWAKNQGVKKIIGMEISKNDLKTAKTIKCREIGFKIGSAIKIPFTMKSFDTVVCWEVLEHIPKGTENIFFKEASRVLKKGGVLYISTPNQSFWSCVLDPAWWLVGHRHYSSKKLKKIVNETNFIIKKIITRGSWWEQFSMLNLYISKWVFRSKPMLEGYFMSKNDKDFNKNKGWSTLFLKLKNG
ncbi:MAG TPA: class I SAM-dependent methyltransferase [Candidatus Woesebacteria bacterium]|nr:class I SAM-dependent methyltransferase [Candidatus Woesebacteria bacterium]